jgi:hypothetical protein
MINGLTLKENMENTLDSKIPIFIQLDKQLSSFLSIKLVDKLNSQSIIENGILFALPIRRSFSKLTDSSII